MKPKSNDPSTESVAADRRRGRGARSNRSGRFEAQERNIIDDGWNGLADLEPFQTTVHEETPRTIITTNQSPDISFDQSINPYRGCEHGCIYCYARPTHCYLGHSAGLDFESQLYVKPTAAKLLKQELSNPRYRCKTIALGTNTDPYQPIERENRITRGILEILADANHPVGIVTKSALVTRDIDILSKMAAKGLAKVALSITTLDRTLARAMEPRASTPPKRLATLQQLSDAGIPTAVMVAPVIPSLNDHEIESILKSASRCGATEAGYVLLRLPLEIKDLFREWLKTEVPDRAKRIVNLLRSMHGGQDYVAEYTVRQRGKGPYADQIVKRFHLALKTYGLNEKRLSLRTDLFEPPKRNNDQMQLL